MAKSKKGSTRNKKSKVKVEDLAPSQDPKGGISGYSYPTTTSTLTSSTLKITDPALNFTVKI